MNRIIMHVCLSAAIGLSLTQSSEAQGPPDRPGPPVGPPSPAGVDTTVCGTVSQFNYDRDGEPEGFKFKDNTLVHLAPRLAAKVETAVRPGDTVQVSGQGQTSPLGLRIVEAQTVQDRTSGKTIAEPPRGAAAPYSGSGKVQQLNYDRAGAVNGFLLDNGTLVRVAPYSASNPTSVQVGAAVSYTGLARKTTSGRTVVDLDSLTLNGQTLRVAGTPTREFPARLPDAPPPPPVPASSSRPLRPPVPPSPPPPPTDRP